MRSFLFAVSLVVAPDCEQSRAEFLRMMTTASTRTLPLDEETLLDKDVVYTVGDTGITVINRGRGMTIEGEGGHRVFATLDVAKGSKKASLELVGWKAKKFAGHSFALTGIGEQYGGGDVKVRVTKP
jgi:hypothetical protein